MCAQLKTPLSTFILHADSDCTTEPAGDSSWPRSRSVLSYSCYNGDGYPTFSSTWPYTGMRCPTHAIIIQPCYSTLNYLHDLNLELHTDRLRPQYRMQYKQVYNNQYYKYCINGGQFRHENYHIITTFSKLSRMGSVKARTHAIPLLNATTI